MTKKLTDREQALLELLYTWWLTDMDDALFFNSFQVFFDADQANPIYRRIYDKTATLPMSPPFKKKGS